jgi:AcrR family transcriptional regulator
VDYSPLLDYSPRVSIKPSHPAHANRGSRRALALREHVFETAIDLFRHHGFDATTMDAIAARADVARATVFNHFRTKDAFLAAYHERMTHSVLGADDPRDARDPVGAIKRLFDRFGLWAENDRAIASALIARIFASPEVLAQDLADEADLNAWIVAHLRAARSAGRVSKSLDVVTFTDLLIGTLSSTALDWVVTGMRGSLRSRLRKRLSLLLSLAGSERT